MSNKSISLLSFGIFSLVLYVIGFPFKSVLLSSLLVWTWIANGMYVTYLLYKNKNILLSIFLLLNIIVQIYFLFNYFYFDEIFPLGPYDFSAYKIDNIQVATNVLFLVFSIMMFVWSFYSKIIFMSNKTKIKLKFSQILTSIRRNSQRKLIYGLFAVSLIGLVIFLLTATIYQAPYPYNKKLGIISFPDSLRPLLVLPYLFAYMVTKIKKNFRNTVGVIGYKILFFMALYFILLLIGPRGAATGLVILIMFFDLFTDRQIVTKLFNLSIALFILYVMIFLWPTMRFDIFSIGFFDAFFQAWKRQSALSSSFFSVQFSLIPMIPQTMFHFLYVVELVNRGIELHYQTFIHLIHQQMPAFFEPIFGARPLNDNWLLMKYYFHGGGFYIFANAYWNGGIIPMVLFTSVVVWLLVIIEKFFKNIKEPMYFLAYPVFVFLIPVNTLYGIQPFIRGLEFGVVALFIIYIYRKVRIKRK